MAADTPRNLDATSDRGDYPDALCTRERELISERRRLALGKPASIAGSKLPEDTVALALSGGGIRSATFCLGVLQALARATLLRKVDILSTVSGGGYCGGFLGAMINRPPSKDIKGIDAAEAELANPRSAIVNWLRQNGRYLSPNGSGDTWLAFAVMLRNWIAVQVVLITTVIAGLAVVVVIRVLLEEYGYPASAGIIWWSPLWGLSLVLSILAAPLGCAYWLAPRIDPKTGKAISVQAVFSALLLVVLLAAAFELIWRQDAAGGSAGDKISALRYALSAAVLLLSTALMGLAALWLFSRSTCDNKRPDRRTRTLLSSIMAQLLKYAVMAAAVALIDSLGETLYTTARAGGGIGIGQMLGLLGAGGAAGIVRPLVTFAQRTNGKARVPLPLGVIAGGAALLIAGTTLIVLSAGVHAVAREALLVPWELGSRDQLWSALILMASALLLSYLMGTTIRFANDSSQQALYGARLARAYLGASNPARREREGGRDVTEPIPGDDPALDEYAPFAHGGPLHLINLTLNETVSGESQIEHRDRKGLIMTIGPAGISAGVRHHALWGSNGSKISTDRIQPIAPSSGYQIFISNSPPADAPAGSTLQAVEPLSLSTWVAISGAAAGPGLGALTSLGFSLLLTFFNVRLGYWWDSYIAPRARGAHGTKLSPAQHFGRVFAWLFPVQTYLFYELLARFYGPNRRHWYLSDGGHFENTACYELIRRRVPFIIVCDCGQDSEFHFADVANLIRKVRTDFDAEIRFLKRDELASWNVDERVRDCFGVPTEFTPFVSAPDAKPSADRPVRPCAMLARVDYDGRAYDPESHPDSVILFLKPSLVGDEPEDVLNYQATHPEFPHQTTGDQYFDEAQWEAYRKLGDVIASRVFSTVPTAEGKQAAWSPRAFTKPRAGAS